MNILLLIAELGGLGLIGYRQFGARAALFWTVFTLVLSIFSGAHIVIVLLLFVLGS